EVAALRERLSQAGAPHGVGELVFVIDEAIDDSEAIATEIAETCDWVRVVTLSRNFGQHPATIAGVLHTSGDWVATLDEDLQHRPERIEDMLREAIAHSSDVVYAKPKTAVHKRAYRDLSSRGVKALIAFLTGDRNVVRVNSFRLMRGQIARAAASVCAPDVFFDSALLWFTSRVRTVEFAMEDTRFIETQASGYSLRKLLSHARRLILSSQIKLLRLGGAIGLLIVLLTAILAFFMVVRAILAPEAVPVRGWTSLIVTVMFFGGATMALLGVIIEYISLMVLRLNGKPVFFTVDRRSDKALKAWFETGGAAAP
ncbi:hypothetical protein AY599_02160, partial [Leptolyngbya valderiana BDU 20041]